MEFPYKWRFVARKVFELLDWKKLAMVDRRIIQGICNALLPVMKDTTMTP